jgi:hypothetical protein
MDDIKRDFQALSASLVDAAQKVTEYAAEAHEATVAANSFSMALLSHPAFDAVRIEQLRARAKSYSDAYHKARRAERCIRFLEYIAQAYEDSEVMHPLARLFKYKISPTEDSKGNACFFHGDTVMDAIEAWAEKTSFSRKEEDSGEAKVRR